VASLLKIDFIDIIEVPWGRGYKPEIIKNAIN